jgi:valyl-tRNA synthetase
MDKARVEGYRNFATKLWNAARFCQSNGIGASSSLAAPVATLAVNKWIIGEVVETLAELDKAMAELRFDAAANAIYHFVFDEFCDWYIELIKGNFNEETKAVAGWVLDQILVMLHPFMPFITEELWDKLGEREFPLIIARWPKPSVEYDDIESRVVIGRLIDTIDAVRSARAEVGISPSIKLTANVAEPDAITRLIASEYAGPLERLGRIEKFVFSLPDSSAVLQVVTPSDTLMFSLEGVIDITAEKARLTKALEASTKEAKSLEGRLSNPTFVEKAKPEAVDKARADHAAHATEAERLAAALARLG